MAEKLYGQAYSALDHDTKNEIYKRFPVQIIYPNKIEYDFLKDLKDKGTLNTFIEEHYESSPE